MISRFLTLSLLVLGLGGCSELDNCPDERDDVVEITDRMSDPAAGIYSSVPWEGPRDPFPAKTLMRFEHALGTTPEVVTTYVSFSAKDHDVTENAGNQGRIRCVDNTDIWLVNDTCEEGFYVRVAAWASGSTDTTCKCQDRFDGLCE